MSIKAEMSDRYTEIERVVGAIERPNLRPRHFGQIIKQPHDNGNTAESAVRVQHDQTVARLGGQRGFVLINLRRRQFRYQPGEFGDEPLFMRKRSPTGMISREPSHDLKCV